MPQGSEGTGRTARQASRAKYEEKRSDPRPLMSVADAATYLATSRWTVYRLIDVGELKAVKVGAFKKIRPADIDDYLERQSN
jgi:excisionase family DNA binding protein